MAISYVGGVQGGRAGATTTTTQSINGTLTGGTDSSPSPGDLVVAFVAVGGDTVAALSQGVTGNTYGVFPSLTFQSQLGTTYDSFHSVSYAIMGSTVDTTLTIRSSQSARNAQRWVIHVFRGVDATTPLDVTSTYATGTATGRPNPAAITPVTAGAWIMAFYASAAATGAAYTAPTDFATDWLGGTQADTADCMAGAGYYTGWTSGSYDPAAITAGGTTNAADAWTATTIALRPIIDPAFSQDAFRLYADGTESGSTALAAQDTNYTADVSGGDFNLGLRVRIQEDNGGAGASTDDYQLQYELNDSASWLNVAAATTTATYYFDGSDAAASDPDAGWTNDANAFDGSTTTYADTSQDGGSSLYNLFAEGTDAPASGGTITSVRARVWAYRGGPGSSIQADIYTDGLAELLGSPTASSSTAGGAWGSYTSLSTPTGGWTWAKVQALECNAWPNNAINNLMELYRVEVEVTYETTGSPVVPFASTNLTDSGATTNRLGSGTGSFVAGEVSEDGLVDDLQITASNYTELLYSLTLVSSALANNDTLDFRVLRNGAVLDTYTVTPRVTASKSANYSGTPGIATLTLTAQTPTVSLAQNITTASPTALTLTAQTPSATLSDNKDAVPGTASLTITAQTPTVALSDNKAITLASPTAIVISPQTTTVTLDNRVTPGIIALTTTNYTPTVAATNNIAVTPGTAALTLTAQTPTLTFTDNKQITLQVQSLTLAPQTPSVSVSDNKAITLAPPSSLTLTSQTPTAALSDNKFVTTASPSALALSPQTPTSRLDNRPVPGVASLVLTAQTPTVTATNNIAVTPGTASLVTSTFSIGVAVSNSSSITPGTASLTLTPQTPSVAATANVSVTPGTASLTTSIFTPSVSFTANVSATPGTASLTLTRMTPTVVGTDNRTATPNTASLSLTTFTPTVETNSGPVSVTPGTATLVTSRFAPDVSAGSNVTVAPGVARLSIRTSYPIVNGAVRQRKYYIDSDANIYWILNEQIGLVEKV